MLAVEDGRDVPWSVDVLAAAERMSRCEQGWVLLFDGEAFRAAPMLCGGRWCPRCARSRVGRIAHRWVPVLVAAVLSGAVVYHITLTQPVGLEPPPGIAKSPALVLPSERARYIGQALTGKAQRAVPGESILGSYLRFREHWRSVRQDRGTRDLWRYALGGYLYGIEWTLRPKNARGRRVPRWHCHAHILAVCPGGWAKGTWERLRDSWCAEVPGASPDAQRCDPVKGSGEQSLADALLEVCKYPLKLAELTIAAKIEAFASLRGTRPHHVGGALHQAARGWEDGERVAISGQEPWRTWLAEKGQPPRWPRLQWLNPRTKVWETYTGQVHTGESHCWRLGEDRPHWEAPADRYWSMMREGLLDAGYAERDGVVFDDSAELEDGSDEGAA